MEEFVPKRTLHVLRHINLNVSSLFQPSDSGGAHLRQNAWCSDSWQSCKDKNCPAFLGPNTESSVNLSSRCLEVPRHGETASWYSIWRRLSEQFVRGVVRSDTHNLTVDMAGDLPFKTYWWGNWFLALKSRKPSMIIKPCNWTSPIYRRFSQAPNFVWGVSQLAMWMITGYLQHPVMLLLAKWNHVWWLDHH